MRDPNPGPLEPLGDRLILRRLEAETITPGGIVLADTAQEKSNRAKVLAVGPGRWENGVRVPTTVCEGEVVRVPAYGGVEQKVNGETLLIFRESEVFAVEHEGAAWS